MKRTETLDPKAFELLTLAIDQQGREARGFAREDRALAREERALGRKREALARRRIECQRAFVARAVLAVGQPDFTPPDVGPDFRVNSILGSVEWVPSASAQPPVADAADENDEPIKLPAPRNGVTV